MLQVIHLLLGWSLLLECRHARSFARSASPAWIQDRAKSAAEPLRHGRNTDRVALEGLTPAAHRAGERNALLGDELVLIFVLALRIQDTWGLTCAVYRAWAHDSIKHWDSLAAAACQTSRSTGAVQQRDRQGHKQTQQVGCSAQRRTAGPRCGVCGGCSSTGSIAATSLAKGHSIGSSRYAKELVLNIAALSREHRQHYTCLIFKYA